MAKFTHKTATGQIQTRTSKTKDYKFVVVGELTAEMYIVQCGDYADGDDVVLRWSETRENAVKALDTRDMGSARNQRVEAINGGERA